MCIFKRIYFKSFLRIERKIATLERIRIIYENGSKISPNRLRGSYSPRRYEIIASGKSIVILTAGVVNAHY